MFRTDGKDIIREQDIKIGNQAKGVDQLPYPIT